jgi:UPF0271 protein
VKGVIDLNADIGEGFPYDEELLRIITSANVCCGAHAGSTALTEHTLELCRRNKVRPGAHPGYRDRENMGRISAEMPDDEAARLLLADLRKQVGSFTGFRYVKPHGALYHDTGADERRAGVVTALLVRCSLPLMGFPGTLHIACAKAAGVAFIAEGFADRRYGEDGRLVSRSQPDALLSDEAEIRAQVVDLAERVDSICLHGDGDHCVEIARLVKAALIEASFEVRAS